MSTAIDEDMVLLTGFSKVPKRWILSKLHLSHPGLLGGGILIVLIKSIAFLLAYGSVTFSPLITSCYFKKIKLSSQKLNYQANNS